jgi:hypothetical protein
VEGCRGDTEDENGRMEVWEYGAWDHGAMGMRGRCPAVDLFAWGEGSGTVERDWEWFNRAVVKDQRGHTEITPYDSITEISIFLAPV